MPLSKLAQQDVVIDAAGRRHVRRLDGLPQEGDSLTEFRKSGADYSIDPDTGCWNWLKALSPAGYASGYGHRRYYEAARGPIPDGHHVHHLCRNRRCVNPDHLTALSFEEHLEGHILELNNLTLEDMARIREMGRNQDITQEMAAEMTGLHRNAIQRLWAGETWGKITGGEPCLPERTCGWCGSRVTGRRNKRYCDKTCREAFNHNGRRPKAA
jgi:hypothetical protein